MAQGQRWWCDPGWVVPLLLLVVQWLSERGTGCRCKQAQTHTKARTGMGQHIQSGGRFSVMLAKTDGRLAKPDGRPVSTQCEAAQRGDCGIICSYHSALVVQLLNGQ